MDVPAVRRINRADVRKVGGLKAADLRADVPTKAAGRSRLVLLSKAAGRRARAVPVASRATIVAAAMADLRRENRGRKVPVRAAPMNSSPSPNRSSRSRRP